MSLIEQLHDNELFTKTELEIIQFINSNPHLMTTLSINELAALTYSSNASIIRICKKLGFNGFRDFKMEYIRQMESLKYIQDDIDFSFPFQHDEPTWQIINHISNVYKESIDLINGSLDIAELESIVNILDHSQRVFVYAIGDSRITAMNFTNKLVKIGKFFFIATENREEDYFSRFATSHDAALFISYSQSLSYKNSLRSLLQRHCQIISITSQQNSILTKYAHHHIVIPHKENSDKIATFYSQIAFQYVLSIIYSLLYKKFKEARP